MRDRSRGQRGKYLSSATPSAELRPHDDPGVEMRPIFAGVGRPTEADTDARTRELLLRVATGEPLHVAAKTARVDPERILRLVGTDPTFRQALFGLLDDREGQAA